MRKPLQFVNEIRKQWGTIVTSGAIIGALTIWQGLGHHLPPSVYWTISVGGLVMAVYRVWQVENIKYEESITALDHEKSLHGGPEISLSWPKSHPTKARLILENTGTIDAYEVKVSDICLNRTRCAARFPAVTKCLKNSTIPLDFELYGNDVPLNHKDELQMIVTCALNSDLSKDEKGNYVVDIPITVTFEEYGGVRYKANFQFLADLGLEKVDIHRVNRTRLS